MCRHGFRHVVDINRRLIRMLARSGAENFVDMDELLKREALDVIGQQCTVLFLKADDPARMLCHVPYRTFTGMLPRTGLRWAMRPVGA